MIYKKSDLKTPKSYIGLWVFLNFTHPLLDAGRNVGAQQMEKKKGDMEKEKKEYSQFGHSIFSSVELQKWKVYFYISTFLHLYGDNSKFWQALSQST